MKKVENALRLNLFKESHLSNLTKWFIQLTKLTFICLILGSMVGPQLANAGEGTGHHLVIVQEGDALSLMRLYPGNKILAVIFDNGEEMPIEYFQELTSGEKSVLYPRIFALKIKDCIYYQEDGFK